MKKISFMLLALMMYDIVSSQFAGTQQLGIWDEPRPVGLRPESTNTFLSQYLYRQNVGQWQVCQDVVGKPGIQL